MDALSQLNASLAGRYTIEREIGRGGMATVYMARDVRHNRRVALKVLNPELGAVLGVERFLSEIQVTANLQHPNLLPLFDSGEADGLLFYVMPYIDGESLRARLDREKQLAIDEAVHLATAVASALDYAHRHGVIHRDLKPENILLHEGQPVVADFGIALAVSNAGGGRITQTGLSLGTPQYMSPEQATGDRVIDGRTDVYSLGAVVYEMLTGEPPHTGTTAQAIIAKVLTDRPRSIRLARDTVPQHVEGAVEKALAKLPADRFHSAQAFADAILGKAVVLPGEIVTPSSLVRSRKPKLRRIARAWYVWLPWTVLGLALALYLSMPARSDRRPTTKFILSLPSSASMNTVGGFLEMSPTGQGFAYVGQSNRGPLIFYRAMDEPQVRPVAGTENGVQPFISFDGEWLGFNAQGKLMKVPLSGGVPQIVTDLGTISPTGFAWGKNGRIVFGQVGGGLMQVSAGGGRPTEFTRLDSGEVSHRGPSFLSDGETVAFAFWHNTDDPRIGFVMPGGKVVRTSQAGNKVRAIGKGLLLFGNPQGGTVFAARFNADRWTIGEPVPVLSDVFVRPGGFSAWAASINGSVIALLGEATARLVAVDRTGAPQSLSDETKVFARPRVSPDGSRIALQVGIGFAANNDVWVFERASHTLSRLTFGGANSDPMWTRDGKRVVFSGRAERGNPENDLFWQVADGSAAAEPLLRAPGRQFAAGWSADGSLILDELNWGSLTRISSFRLGDSSTKDLVRAPPNSVTRFPSVSPDGRWFVYASNETGRMEVYVSALPGPRGKWQVSTNGGDQPIWSKSGREIFYRDPSHVVAVRVATVPTFAVQSRTRLFEDVYLRLNTTNWDVMPGDRQFVMLQPTEEAARIMVITNWIPEIERKLDTVRK